MIAINKRERSFLDQTADIAEELNINIGNLSGAACLLRIDLDDSEQITRLHRQTMATIQSMLEYLERDAERLTDNLAKLQHDEQMQKAVVGVK